MHLFDFLFPPRVDQALIRDVSIDTFLQALRPHAVPTTPETVALLPFASAEVRAAIHEAKYHCSAHAFDLLGASVVEYLRDSDSELRKPVLVPIPLGRARRKERGYNQVEEVVMRASKELGIHMENDMLVRTRETASQVSLTREARRENMHGAFTCSRGGIDSKHTYILVDDVITTGATLQSAIEALRAAGAIHIVPIALAH